MSVSTDVLIVGGGPAGLTAAIACDRAGLRSVLVESHPGTSLHPKALHLSMRSMEIFRGWGLTADLNELALPLSDHALYFGSSVLAGQYVRNVIWQPEEEASPERSTLVSQEIMEPCLRRHAEQGSCDVRFSTRLVGLDPGADRVVARLEDRSTGAVEELAASYVIGADGADSDVREQLGIGFPGRDYYHSVNIRFRADLGPRLGDRRSMMYYVFNDDMEGLLPAVDNDREWRLMVGYFPERGQSPADFEDPDERIRLVRSAIGDPELDVELGDLFTWVAAGRLADRFQVGRVFLAGDAAHVNLPSGGLGMNLGIQDVHNLVWKLAAVEQGWAGEALLSTYGDERRPVAARTIDETVRSNAFEATKARTEEEQQIKHRRRKSSGLVLGFRYESPAVVPDGSPPPSVGDPFSDYIATARPGHRFPHAAILCDGESSSSIDLADYASFVLIAGPDGGAWADAVAAGATGDVPVRAHLIGSARLQDPDGLLLERCGIGDDGAVVVRPDGHVAFRAAEMAGDPAEALRRVVAAVR